MLLSDKENLELPVNEIMEKSVVILDESTSVSAAAEIMKTKEFLASWLKILIQIKLKEL